MRGKIASKSSKCRMQTRSLCVLLTTTCLILAPMNACANDHPSDKALVENFQAHKADFNELLQMFLTDDGLVRVDLDRTDPKETEALGITEARLVNYRTLFRKLGLTRGISGYGGKKRILFLSSTKGLGISGSGKGYAYSITPLEPIAENLESYESKDGKSFTVYKHIEGNWYLFFDFVA